MQFVNAVKSAIGSKVEEETEIVEPINSKPQSQLESSKSNHLWIYVSVLAVGLLIGLFVWKPWSSSPAAVSEKDSVAVIEKPTIEKNG